MREWTTDQSKAIHTSGNLLVSAAAGSGKTAVLVERIKNMLIPNQNSSYVPADSLLVVTFARDAAQEMQERLKKALYEELKTTKDMSVKAILKEQMKKLPFADISTIDSFCIKIVRQNFNLLGIDPNFKIFDPAESKVFLEETMQECFDKLYDEKNQYFYHLVSLYGRSYDDRELKYLITEVYNFTRSLADPDCWLSKHGEDYKSFSHSPYFDMIVSNYIKASTNALNKLISLKQDYSKAVGSTDPDVLTGFGATDLWSVLEADIKALSTEVMSWDDIADLDYSFHKINKSSSKKEDAVEQNGFIDLRENIISPIKWYKTIIHEKSKELDSLYANELHMQAKSISEITQYFSEFIFNKKNKLARFEFNDLEHMAAEIIKNNEDIRLSLQNKYVEILMDEYQDTNELQEEIFNLISNGSNRFMVGDMKQSIYRFRSSDPLIFRNCDDEYSKENAKGTKVVLSKNFRSRETVLESINDLFERIMTREVGEIDYNNEQRLYYGNKSFDSKCEDNNYKSELYVIQGSPSGDEDSITNDETEAEFVANKIRQMIDSHWQIKADDGFRDITPGDFAILMSSTSSSSGVYIEALKKRGINSYVEDKDFFGKLEIRLLTEFIKTVNNPYTDISLVSVMRSPVYRFSDEELAKIRLAADGEFWNCVIDKSTHSDKLGIKCKAFVEEINRWRSMSEYLSAERLVWRILTDCSLYDMCGILYGGEAALDNIRMFMDMIAKLADSGISTLYDFTVYLDRMKESNGISVKRAQKDAVPVMTIHKSKGLEFPVVFVCGMGKKFIFEGKGRIINIHKDYGYGLDFIRMEQSYCVPTINRRIIAEVRDRENVSELLRKLYVALTRAKEKLIVTGVVKPTKSTDTFAFTEMDVTEENISKSTNYLKIIAPVIKKFGKENWVYQEIVDVPDVAVYEEATDSLNKEFDGEIVKKYVYELLDKYDSVSETVSIPAKVSVSDLKNLDAKSGMSLQKMPSFMNGAQLGGANFGTSIHRIMEEINLNTNMDDEYIANEIRRITGTTDSTQIQMISAFFSSDLGVRALNANPKREQSFETQIPALSMEGKEIQGEFMLLQGIIDMYFEEPDGLVLVDYKTDKCDHLSELAEKYKVQLKWYKYSMEKLLKKNVKETYIYSFNKNSYIKINGDEINE